jgi:hypothetical protein
MKTLQEIKDEVAQSLRIDKNTYRNCEHFLNFYSNRHPEFFETYLWNEVAKRYAEEAINDAVERFSLVGMNESELQDRDYILNVINELK